MRKHTFQALIFISVVALALGTVGCGDDDSSGSTDPTTDTGTGDTTDTGDDTTDTGTDDTTDTGDPEPEASCRKGAGCFEGNCCTCTPVGCQEGIDNSLSGLAGLANSSFQSSIDDGSVNLIAEFAGDIADGKEFPLNMYNAQPDFDEDTCDITQDACDWQIQLAAFADDCSPLIAFGNAMIVGDTLTAGGKDGVFKLSIPIQGLVLELTVTLARIEGSVTRDGEGNIIGISGILAGAIPKASLEEAVDNLPEDGLPISKDAIKNILANVVKSDIDGLDANGDPGSDGEKESASVSIIFEGLPGNITSVEQPSDDTTDTGDDTTDTGGDTGGGDTGDGDGMDDNHEGCQEPPAADTFSNVSFRLVSLKLGDSGKAGQGLDVDGICEEPDPGFTDSKGEPDPEWCPAAE